MIEQNNEMLDQNMLNAALELGLLEPGEVLDDRFDKAFRKNVQMMHGYLSHNPPQKIIAGTIAYFFVKAIEHSISYDLYDNLGVFSVPLSPDDIGQGRFRSNLPNHLDDLVNEELKTGSKLAEAYLARTADTDPASEQSDRAYQTALLIADTYAQKQKFSKVTVRDYPNALLLTPNEYRKLAAEMFLPLMEKQIEGCDILEKDFSLDPYFNVIARYQQGLHFILFAIEVSPREPKVLSQSFYALIEEAKSQGASAYIISLGIRSKDEQHFQDGVLLRNEPAMYRLNDFREIDIPKGEERMKQEAALQERVDAARAADRAETN